MQKIIEKILNLIKLFQEINFQEKIKNLSKNYYEFCEFVDTNVARGYKNTIEFLIKFQEKSNKIFHRLETITNQEIIDIILMNIIKIQKNFYDILINLYNIGKKISVGIKNIIVFFYKDIKELELANHLKKKFNIIRFFRKIKDHWDNFRDTDFYVRHLKLSATPEQMGYLNEEIHVPIYRPVLYILGVINLAIWNYAQYYDPFAWAMGESDILAPLFMYMAIHHLNDDNIVGSGWETNWGGRYDQPNLWARMGEEEDEDWEAYLDDKDASDFEDELLDYYINSWSDMGDKYTLVYKEEDDETELYIAYGIRMYKERQKRIQERLKKRKLEAEIRKMELDLQKKAKEKRKKEKGSILYRIKFYYNINSNFSNPNKNIDEK